jgi:hypothetical protein
MKPRIFLISFFTLLFSLTFIVASCSTGTDCTICEESEEETTSDSKTMPYSGGSSSGTKGGSQTNTKDTATGSLDSDTKDQDKEDANDKDKKPFVYEFPFTLENVGKTMVINIFSRGYKDDEGNQVLSPNSFDLEENDHDKTFPIGTWINQDDETEHLVFDEDTFTRYSRFFDTYKYEYEIKDSILYLILIETIENPDKIILPDPDPDPDPEPDT